MRHRPCFLRGPGEARLLPAFARPSLDPRAILRGGRRADRRNLPCECTHPLADAWRLSARHRGVFLTAPGRALPANRFFPPSPGRDAPRGALRLPGRGLRSTPADLTRSAVSQLLAGGRSTPGRSPGAARVRGHEPRPQAPHQPKRAACAALSGPNRRRRRISGTRRPPLRLKGRP